MRGVDDDERRMPAGEGFCREGGEIICCQLGRER